MIGEYAELSINQEMDIWLDHLDGRCEDVYPCPYCEDSAVPPPSTRKSLDEELQVARRIVHKRWRKK